MKRFSTGEAFLLTAPARSPCISLGIPLTVRRVAYQLFVEHIYRVCVLNADIQVAVHRIWFAPCG